MENVGETLKEHRVTRELSQIQLAQATGIKQQNISRWENNIHLPDIAECI
ncbi:MAG: helix-turn-helix domain-containing protein, partial [Coriobacteriales bacterium]